MDTTSFTFDQLLEVLSNLPSIPLDAEERIAATLRDHFGIGDDDTDEEV